MKDFKLDVPLILRRDRTALEHTNMQNKMKITRPLLFSNEFAQQYKNINANKTKQNKKRHAIKIVFFKFYLIFENKTCHYSN